MRDRLYPWEAAALLALCAALVLGLWAERRQTALSEHVIRLHVIAASDSAADQAEKLRVRDAVLSLAGERLSGTADADAAAEALRGALPDIAALAAQVSGRSARAELGRESYPTRTYEGFSLPAGTYTSLRVTLGEGAGRNWWCVVYPPLCTAAAEEIRQTAALPEEDLRLISGKDGEVVFRFRVIEWWEKLTGRGAASSRTAYHSLPRFA